MRQYKVVVAENLREFHRYMKSLELPPPVKRILSKDTYIDGFERHWIYCSDSEKVRGLRNWDLVKVGNWISNPRIKNIDELYYSQHVTKGKIDG